MSSRHTSSSAIAERPRDALELLQFTKLPSGIFEPPFSGGGLGGLLDNSRIHQLADCQLTGRLADWTSRGLVNSLTGQVAGWTTRGCHLRLCVLSFRFLAIRETASCPVREMSSPRVGNPRVVQLPLGERKCFMCTSLEEAW